MTTTASERRSSRSGPRKTASAPKKATPKARPSGQTSTGLSLPVLVPEVHVRHVPVPKVGTPHLSGVHIPQARVTLPSREKLVWFGGLAGLAALGVVSWPVAGVVAAGTYAAERFARESAHEQADRSGPDEN